MNADSKSSPELLPNFTAPSFLTESGLLVPAVTADQMVEVDRVALEETGPNRFQMMENTGRHLAQQALDCLEAVDGLGRLAPASSLNPSARLAAAPAAAPAKTPIKNPTKTVIVLAGGGMNGGGGICAARHLAASPGITVYLCLASLDSLTDISRWQYHLFSRSEGLHVRAKTLQTSEWLGDAGPVDLIVDALMGCQVPIAPQGLELDLINWANQSGSPILSLDVPSGMDATRGDAPGAVMRSRWTMTLALPKTGMHPDRTGELILADIGIPAKTFRSKTLQLPYRSPFGLDCRIPLHYQAANPEVA